MIAVAHRAALFGFAWAALVRFDPEGLLVGAVIVPLAIWTSLRTVPPRHPLDLWRLARHLPRFIAGSVAGGVDVARRAFSPSMQLSPGWRRVPVSVSRGARAALGAELSLMPGTIAAGADERHLLVHVLTEGNDLEVELASLEAEIASVIERS